MLDGSLLTGQRAGMGLVRCRVCQHRVSSRAAVCPGCGERLRGGSGRLQWLVGLLLLVVGAVALTDPGCQEAIRQEGLDAARRAGEAEQAREGRLQAEEEERRRREMERD